jgi:hypothetical protein
MWHAQTGISHVTPGLTTGNQGPQGFSMSDTQLDLFKTCLAHHQYDDSTPPNSIDCPDGTIQDCFFGFRDAGCDLSAVFKWHIRGCQFYNYSDFQGEGRNCRTIVSSSSSGAAFNLPPILPKKRWTQSHRNRAAIA